MAQTQISTIEIEAKDAIYKQCSGAAIASARVIARISQMKLAPLQRRPDMEHIKVLRESMESEGVRKGDAVHAYIDVADPAWENRDQSETISLLFEMSCRTKLTGDGKVRMSVLPTNIPLRLTNGAHRLYAYCSYLVGRWSDISNVREPLESPLTDCPWAENLGKSPAEILAQDDAFWVVSVEYIRR